MTLAEELQALASQLTHGTWRTKPESEWDADERAEYNAWAAVARAQLQRDGQSLVRRVTRTDLEQERTELVGEVLRTTGIVLDGDEAVLVEGPGARFVLPVKDPPPDPNVD